MRKLIAAINMTIDGVFDHTVLTPNEEVHQHYTELLKQGELILYGRITYQLMEYWRTFLDKPSDEKSMNEFAHAINDIQKIVFSNTLTEVDWESASLATNELKEEVERLKQQPGKDIYVGSRSLIIQLLELNLIDEFQLCIHPVVAGGGMALFELKKSRSLFNLAKTKTLKGGAIIHYYLPER